MTDASDSIVGTGTSQVVRPAQVTDVPLAKTGVTNDTPRVLSRQIPPSVMRGNIQLGTPNLSVDSANVRIITTDIDGTPRVIMGATGIDSATGATQYGLKVSKPGFDATTATDSELVFNSNQNVFKIVRVVEFSYTMTAADLVANYVMLTIPHGLDTIPQVTASFTSQLDGSIRLLPFLFFTNQSYYGLPPSAAVVIDRVDNTNIHVNIEVIDLAGLSLFSAGNNLMFKFYCLVETAD